MSIISVLKFITNHPLNRKNKVRAIFRFLKWQVRLRLIPLPVVYAFTDKSKLLIRKGMSGATGNLYCGLHEFNDMSFLLHFLRESDTFADIGANVGSFTVLASAHVGAYTFSFEPVPTTFAHLVENISINQIQDKVTAANIALGAKKGTLDFTDSLDTMNHVAKGEGANTIKVNVETVDEIFQNQKVPILFKIDVEGFETEVVRGASTTFQQEDVKAIIIELPGVGSRYGYDESKIHDTFISLNFRPYHYNPLERTLVQVEKFGTHNTLYLRDLYFIEHRLHTAPKVRIQNIEL